MSNNVIEFPIQPPLDECPTQEVKKKKKIRKSILEHIRNDWDKSANLITEGRLLFSFIPAFFLWMYTDDEAVRWVITAVFLGIVLTDMLDGYVARKKNEVTELGKLMDPFVDKVLIIQTLVSMSVSIDRNIWFLTALIFAREASVTALRRHAREKRGIVIAAGRLGKWKMVSQSTFGVMMLIPFSYIGIWMSLIKIVAFTMIALTIISGIEYFWNYLSGNYTEDSDEEELEADADAVDEATSQDDTRLEDAVVIN